MQPTPSFDWGRLETPTRWVARILGGVAYVAWVGFSLLFFTFSGERLNPPLEMVAVWVVIAAGLVVAIVSKGIGEVAGGVILIGGVVVEYISSGLLIAPMFTIPIVIAGLLFISCGWYMLAQRNRGATRATA